jgi:hypothetical protein
MTIFSTLMITYLGEAYKLFWVLLFPICLSLLPVKKLIDGLFTTSLCHHLIMRESRINKRIMNWNCT